MIKYTSNIDDISSDKLEGFFVGWAKPLTKEQHYNHIANCAYFVLAMDDDKVIGFISALSDGIGCAFIPLIEVLPEYQKRGIGSELMRQMLEILKDISSIDLMCDENVQGFYEKFGMKKLSGMAIRR
jgi:ribosomal protein S18 acetylase RimI-like enzyme